MSLPIRMDSWKMVSGVILIIVSILAYYQFLQAEPFVLRFAVLLAGVGIGIAFVLWGREGKLLVTYLGDVRGELRKVVWPERQQAGQMTLLVIAMVIVVAIFLGLLDWFLSSLIAWFMG